MLIYYVYIVYAMSQKCLKLNSDNELNAMQIEQMTICPKANNENEQNEE